MAVGRRSSPKRLDAFASCVFRELVLLPAIEIFSFRGSPSCCHSRSCPMLSLCKVADSLFISNARSACTESLLRQEGVTFCINVSRQQPFPNLQPLQTLRVAVFDDPSEDLYKYFERCGDAIQSTIQSGGKCLVYCKNGRSRSAAVCTAYLMKHRKLSLKDAFEAVKTARPVAEPNEGFWSQLQKYEQYLHRLQTHIDNLVTIRLCVSVFSPMNHACDSEEQENTEHLNVMWKLSLPE